MAERAQGLRDIPRQAAHIGPRTAGYLENRVVGVRHGGERDRLDQHRPRLQIEDFSFARKVIGPLSRHLDRRIARRDLLDLPRKARQDRPDAGRIGAHGRVFDDRAVRIVRIGRDAPAQGESIGFRSVNDVAHGLRRFAQRHRQDAGRQRVQRSAMSGLGRVGQPPHLVDHGRRRHARRLVDDEPAIHGIAAALASAHLSPPSRRSAFPPDRGRRQATAEAHRPASRHRRSHRAGSSSSANGAAATLFQHDCAGIRLRASAPRLPRAPRRRRAA